MLETKQLKITDPSNKGGELAHWVIVFMRGLCLLAGLASGVPAVFLVTDSDLWPVAMFFLCISFLCFRFAFRGHIARERVVILIEAVSGVLLGLCGYFGGGFWAGYRYPDNNLAPIMVITQTAPMGFVMGMILGIILGGSFYPRKDEELPWQ